MLRIHFLDVGHGDCTIVEHPSGNITMVDINNGRRYDWKTLCELAEEYLGWTPLAVAVLGEETVCRDLWMAGYETPLVNPLDYLAQHFPNRPVHRYIQSHPDLDHMRGFDALMQRCRVLNFWDTANTKVIADFRDDTDEADWLRYQFTRGGGYSNVTLLNCYADDRAPLFNRDADGTGYGDGIEILSPTPDLVHWCNARGDSNNLSYVLRLHYGGRTIVLGGDAEDEAWSRMVACYGPALTCDVLKASHHGRDSGFHAEAVDLMAPQVVVVSVGRKPNTDAHAKYAWRAQSVLSTRRWGTLVLTVHPNGAMEWQTV